MGIIAIGDIHGCAQTLELLLERLSLSAEDRLVFIGDYVDRGPDSRGVIDRLLRLREETPCTFLRGNHEALMIDYLDHKNSDLWWVNGGLQTVNSYRTNACRIDIPPEHADFVRSTVLYHDTPEFFFVHAGLRPELTVRENMARCGEEVFLWDRSHFEAKDTAWEKPVVVGHTPHPQPVNKPRLICIDTGCVYFTRPGFGKLTAVRLPERAFVSVDFAG